jgi:adenylosuccinate synthase
MLNPEALADAVHEQVRAINWQLTSLYQADPLDSQQVAAEMVDYARQLASYIGDVSGMLASAIKNGKRVLAEGAQGTLLDLDHGTYPFVTSSYATAPGALLGLGLGVGCVERVIGVTKSFQTRVGEGAFPTETYGEVATRLRGTGENPWDEFGTTTGRPRRVGWLDMVLLRYAARVNGLTELALTKLDILTGLNPLRVCVAYRAKSALTKQDLPFTDLPFGPGRLDDFEPVYEDLPGWEKDLKTVRKWEDLPREARAYILKIEELSQLPVSLVSVGPERGQIVEIE